MVMINGTLYLDTGKESQMGVANEVDGTIKTNVSQDKKPVEHEQSNFGFVGSKDSTCPTGWTYLFRQT